MPITKNSLRFKIIPQLKSELWSSHCGKAEKNLRSMRMWVQSLASSSGWEIQRGVCRRLGLDPRLLWPWCRPAAVSPIRPQAIENSHMTKVRP